MSIHWIKNVIVDQKKTTFEILLGNQAISDKCYIRINSGPENWFTPKGDSRDEILQQGIDILKNKFKGDDTFGIGGDYGSVGKMKWEGKVALYQGVLPWFFKRNNKEEASKNPRLSKKLCNLKHFNIDLLIFLFNLSKSLYSIFVISLLG